VPPQSPTTALTASTLSTEAFSALASAREGGLTRSFIRLGPINGFACRNGELLYRAPDDLLLLVASDEPVSLSVVNDAILGCRWVLRHPERIREALGVSLGKIAATGDVALRLRLAVPGFRNDLAHWSIHACCPTEVVQLGEAIDELGRAFVLRRTERLPANGHSMVPQRALLSGPAHSRRKPTARSGERQLDSLFTALHEHAALACTITESTATVLSTSAALNAYCVLVVLAARLLLISTPPTARIGTHRAGAASAQSGTMLRDALKTLGQVAAYFADGAPDVFGLRIPRKPWPKSLSAACAAFARKYGIARHAASATDLSSVPPTFTELLEDMAGSSLPLQRSRVSDATARESAGAICEDAAASIVHAVYAAFGCELVWGTPRYVSSQSFFKTMLPSGAVSAAPGLMAVRADLARVVCAHRLLVELGRLPDASIRISMLGDAIEVALELAADLAKSTDVEMSSIALYHSAQNSIAALKSSGGSHRRSKEDSKVLGLCLAQEKLLGQIFEALP
jgi:hypothetical protein